MPEYHFRERHSRWIAAPVERVWQSLTSFTLEDLTITRPLVALRHLTAPTGSAAKPLFTDGPVQMLEVAAPRYAVGGTVARPWQRTPERREVASLQEFAGFAQPGWTKYVTDFVLEPRDDGVQLSTETRGYSTDRYAQRRFQLYWTVIRPASGLIRRDILATVARQATRLPPLKGDRSPAHGGGDPV